jgi:hypothetical protein
MKLLCTFPGRAGDILWALPSVRALAELHDTRVDFAVAGEFASLVPLLEQRAPYLGKVWAEPNWGLVPPNEWDAPVDMAGYDHVYHLGYRTWPELPLAQFTHLALSIQVKAQGQTLPALELERPWLDGTAPTAVDRVKILPCGGTVAVGFTEAHFELKYGLFTLLRHAGLGAWLVPLPVPNGRWSTEGTCRGVSWSVAADMITVSPIFFGDCSALHVLAVAMGKPVVLMECMEARWNDVFYPLGKTGRVRLVTGLDGKPTWDARHCADALREALK